MHASPRRVIAALGGALVVTGLAVVPSRAVEDFSLSRIAGADRYATAANIALEAFSGGSDAAVIARGDSFPDALAGSYLTGVLDAPVLLTASNDLPEASVSALDALGVSTVYLLGGTGAISDAVANEATGEADPPREVRRVAGANRYATAAAVATSQDAGGIGVVGGERTALLVSGETFADALAAGPLAHTQRLPVLLTPSGSLAREADSAIETLGIEHLVVVGGTAAVSDAVLGAAESGGVSTERVAGANRYATAAALADFALAEFEDTSDSGVDLATGERFADALAAGPSTGDSKRSLLLTAPTALSSETSTWLADHAGTLRDGRVFGGTGAVADSVVAAAEAAASGEVAGASEGQVTFADTANNVYRFVADGAEVGTSVSYSNSDTFAVGDATATVGGFESSLTAADRIVYTPAAGSAPARHELTNVAASSIVAGTIGNVDVANKQLDFVHPVNGDALRANVGWANVLYEIDGASATLANFEAGINEGDDLAITGSGTATTFELTNTDVTGSAGSIAFGSNPLLPTTDLKVGALGDDPANATNDATYQANDADTFKVEGADSDHATFAGDLTAGDAVTYRRVGGVETFELINRSPSLIEGQAVDDLDPQGAPLPPTPAGGHFSVVTETGPVAVDYGGTGAFIVDGSVADEAEFEAAYTAGDGITYRRADAPSGTTQRIELTNATLEGQVDKDSITTEDSIADPTSSETPNSYGVLGQDGETDLKQVVYVSATASANTYFVNGAAVTLERFEQELDAIEAGTRSGSAEVEVTGSGDSAVTQHRLTTTGSPITTTTTTTTTTAA